MASPGCPGNRHSCLPCRKAVRLWPPVFRARPRMRVTPGAQLTLFGFSEPLKHRHTLLFHFLEQQKHPQPRRLQGGQLLGDPLSVCRSEVGRKGSKRLLDVGQFGFGRFPVLEFG